MSQILKAVLFVLFFSSVVVVLANLPYTTQYPLPPEFATSLALIFGYYFAWGGIFSALVALLLCVFIYTAIEVVIAIFKMVISVIRLVARFVA